MLPGRHFILLAFNALLRNRMQTALAMIGVMVGVAALVTSLALGRGAQESVEDQLRAAGANLIVVTAGNYAKGKEERSDPDGNIGSQRLATLRQYQTATPNVWEGKDRRMKPVTVVEARSRLTGWTAAAVIPQALVEARLRNWIWAFCGFGLLVLATILE